jgi:ligand-binding sensor domain-containing protein
VLKRNFIWSLYIDPKENLWIGCISDGGLYKFNYSTKLIETSDIEVDNVLSIARTNSEKLIIGGRKGVMIYESNTKKSCSSKFMICN